MRFPMSSLLLRSLPALVLVGCSGASNAPDMPPSDPPSPKETVDAGRPPPDAKAVTLSLDAGHADVGTPAPPVDAGHEAEAVDAGTDVALVDAHEAGEDAHDAETDAHEGGGLVLPLVTSPTTLTFGTAGGTAGYVACGAATPATKDLDVRNEGTTLLSYWTELGRGAGSPWQLSTDCTVASPCTLAAAKAVTVVVTPPAISDTSGMTSETDTLTVFSSAPGDLGTTVMLEESPYGAVVATTPGAVAFGKVALHGMYTKTITVKNTGNATWKGTLAVSGSSEVTTSVTSLTVPTTGATFDVVFEPGATTTAVSATVTLTSDAGSYVCEALPAPIKVTGQGM
jgi:hypothetical protein